jgi:uncharacterized membrane protein (DUF2068 family)
MGKQEGHGDRKNGGWLRVIAVAKLLKAMLLLAVGVAAIAAVGHDPPSILVEAANVVGVDPGSRHLHRLASGLAGFDAKKLTEVGFGSFVYAALFLVEGVGLWMQKRWGEYETIAITTSFIPIEFCELVKHFNAVKVVVIALNLAVVVYLVVRVLSERRDRQPGLARLGIASR